MSSSDVIGGATQTLRALLQDRVDAPDALAQKGPVEVTVGLPPAPGARVAPRVNLLLYHVAEDAPLRNAPGRDEAPQPAPRALHLGYLVTAHADAPDAPGDETLAHHLLGAALRALHDHPLVTPSLTRVREPVGGPILAKGLSGAHVRVLVEPLGAQDLAQLFVAMQRPLTAAIASRIVVTPAEESRAAQPAVLVERREPRARWSDLAVPEDALARLRDVAAEAAQPGATGGFGLLTGVDRAEATKAAEALARELGAPLYRVDLSGVLSKYIGETEKNLSRVLDAAEGSGALLYFDEADALFGQRTSVKDSHDRYADTEANALLQRIETYEGIVLLCATRPEALAPALLRRARFHVDGASARGPQRAGGSGARGRPPRG